MNLHHFSILPLACAILLSSGCMERESDQPAEPVAVDPIEEEPSPWIEVAKSPQVVTGADAELMEALDGAVAEARASAEAARQKWSEATSSARATMWAVKWAAPLADGGVEHIWVVPATWSPYRIEGRLANPPRQALACGADLDDVVSFPIEELADWVHWLDDGEPRRREGGFTIDVLEGAYGTPPGETESERIGRNTGDLDMPAPAQP